MTQTKTKHPAIAIAFRALIWLALLGAWEGAYRTVGWKPWKFPAPSHVIDAVFGMLDVNSGFGEPLATAGWPNLHDRSDASVSWYQRPLLAANRFSLMRLVEGFSLSIAIGAALGLSLWRFPVFDRFIGPFLLGIQTLPSVCWVPLSVLVIGINEWSILFVMVLGSFCAIAISLRDGLATIPPLYKRAGLMLGARGWRLYRYVLLPASLPAFATSLRQGFSFAWRSLLGAELILAVEHHGLGFLLQAGRDFADPAQVIAVMIVMIIIGMLADRLLFAKLQKAISTRFGLG